MVPCLAAVLSRDGSVGSSLLLAFVGLCLRLQTEVRSCRNSGAFDLSEVVGNVHVYCHCGTGGFTGGPRICRFVVVVGQAQMLRRLPSNASKEHLFVFGCCQLSSLCTFTHEAFWQKRA